MSRLNLNEHVAVACKSWNLASLLWLRWLDKTDLISNPRCMFIFELYVGSQGELAL